MRTLGSRLWHWIVVLVVLAILAAGAASIAGPAGQRSIRTYSQQSASMIPSVLPGDWFLAVPLRPERGAIVVFQSPPGVPEPGLPLLKRVVGLGGDVVEVRDGRAFVNGKALAQDPCEVPEARSFVDPVNGEKLPEVTCLEERGESGRSYRILCTAGAPCGDVPPTAVPPGHVYVLGDWRDHSQDSRHFGPIPESTVIGVAERVTFSHGREGVRWKRFGQRL